ncbi:MAG: ABC transporter substrate-binding protein [Acidobacteria bacterium]|nr:ABC transporter substrate-binding protein [Acidobacteriota bacterium]
MTSPDLITLAHSPDSDDAFMFYALAEGRVDTEGLSFHHELSDIESLNRRALAGELAVTAVSFHAYAYLADRYLLLPHGASFGDGYGPVLVSRRPMTREEISSGGVTVASPGARTTAALALALWVPGVRTEIRGFDTILEGVRDGEIEAGVLIHEGQLTFAEEGLTEVVDLGRWWKDETGLPLPLGGNVVRRDLGPDRIARVSRALSRSIEYGLEHRDAALAHAMKYARGLDPMKADRFVGMYVNEWTRGYGAEGRRAVQLLLDRAHAAGLVPAVTAEYAPEPDREPGNGKREPSDQRERDGRGTPRSTRSGTEKKRL